MFDSVQHKNGCLATSDLFHMFKQSVKLYTFHYHILKSNPTNTPRVFHVETTWKQSFQRLFNVEYTWSVCREETLKIVIH